MKKIEVVKDAEKEVGIEVLEQAIVDISNAFKKMESGRLKRRAIVLLVRDRCINVGTPAINAVLDSVRDLEEYYLKPKKP